MTNGDEPGDLEFGIAREDLDGSVRLVVRGDVDVATSPQLREALHDAIGECPTSVDLDMRDMAFIDSAGLGALIGARKHADDAGVDLTIEGLQPSPRKVFAITGLDDVFTITED